MDQTLYWELIGTLLALLIGPVPLVACLAIARHERAKLQAKGELERNKHAERLAMIERGIVPPGETPALAAIAAGVDDESGSGKTPVGVLGGIAAGGIALAYFNGSPPACWSAGLI